MVHERSAHPEGIHQSRSDYADVASVAYIQSSLQYRRKLHEVWGYFTSLFEDGSLIIPQLFQQRCDAPCGPIDAFRIYLEGEVSGLI